MLHVESLRSRPRPGTASRSAARAAGESRSTRGSPTSRSSRDLRSALARAAWPGRLSGTAGLHATVDPLDARFDAIDLAGELRGLPLRLRRGRVAAPRTRVGDSADCELTSGSNRRRGRRAFDLEAARRRSTWTRSSPQLDRSAAAASTGALIADPDARRLVLDEPSARGLVEARALELGDYVGGSLMDSRARPASPPQQPLALTRRGRRARARRRCDADAHARAISRARRRLQRIAVDASRAETGQLRRSPRAAASRSGTWRGSVERLDIDEMLLGDWRLRDPRRSRSARGPRRSRRAASRTSPARAGARSSARRPRRRPARAVRAELRARNR